MQVHVQTKQIKMQLFQCILWDLGDNRIFWVVLDLTSLVRNSEVMWIRQARHVRRDWATESQPNCACITSQASVFPWVKREDGIVGLTGHVYNLWFKKVVLCMSPGRWQYPLPTQPGVWTWEPHTCWGGDSHLSSHKPPLQERPFLFITS